MGSTSYHFVRVQGYVDSPSASPQPGKVPLYSWWSPSRGDNFITSDPRWAGRPGDTKSPDYRFVRVEGYVDSPSASPQPGKVPLYSWWNAGRAGGGAMRDTFPAEIPVTDDTAVNVSVVSVGENIDASTVAHELTHAIGIGWESYGSGCKNEYYSLMSCTIGLPELKIFHLDPWAKIRLGWVRPEIITVNENSVIEINATELPMVSTQKAYIVYDEARGKNEFFILEHRFRDSTLNYDNDPWLVDEKGIPDDGLGIWHVLINHTTKDLRIIPTISQFQTPTNKIGLHSWYSPGRKDNFLTSDPRWAWHIANDSLPDYGFSRFEGFIDSPTVGPQPGTVPLYSWWSPSRGDNFITSDPRWAGEPGDTKSPDYGYVGLAGYITSPASAPSKNQAPLYSWWNSSHGDNFTTSDPRWAGAIGANQSDYTLFRLEGYVDKGPAGLDVTLFIQPPEGSLGLPDNENGLWDKSDGAAQPIWFDGSTSRLFVSVRSDSVLNPLILVWVGTIPDPASQ